jgi:hypothetical protein
MDSEKIDYEELTLTVTLLIVIFTILYGVRNYFYNTIIDVKSSSVIVAIYFLVAFLFFEFFSIFSFLLTKGYLASFPEDQLLRLRKINMFLHRLSFGCPLFILITSAFLIPYFYYFGILHLSLSEVIKYFMLILVFVFAAVISIFVLFDIRFDFNFAYLKWKTMKLIREFTKLLSDIFYNRIQVKRFIFKQIIVTFVAIALEFFVLAIIIIGLFYAPTFLLCGAYSINITNPPNADTMSIVILDTGIPSSRCFIHLSQINDTSMELFHEFDNITLVESEFNTSHYMYGHKKEGIWY